MQYAIEKDIELITFEKSGSSRVRRKDEVWLCRKASKETGKPMLYAVRIAANVAEAAAWKVGDTVMLGKVKGASIWVFVPSNRPDAFTLRKAAGRSATAFHIGNGQLAREIFVAAKTEEFEAWAEDCCVYFKPKRKESV